MKTFKVGPTSRSEPMRVSGTIYTIGHSTHDWDTFVGLLHKDGVGLLIDVRSHPGSRRHPQFNRDHMVKKLGSVYCFMGDTLGGPTHGEYSDPHNFPKHHIGTTRSDKDTCRALLSRGCNCGIKPDTRRAILDCEGTAEEWRTAFVKATYRSPGCLHHLYGLWLRSIPDARRSIDKLNRTAAKLPFLSAGDRASFVGAAGPVVRSDDPQLLFDNIASGTRCETAALNAECQYDASSDGHSAKAGGKSKKNNAGTDTCPKCNMPLVVPQWQNTGLFDYGVWMNSVTFRSGLQRLNEICKTPVRPAIMCCESLYWKCHRSMIADAWEALGGEAYHLWPQRGPQRHILGNRLERYEPETRALWEKEREPA